MERDSVKIKMFWCNDQHFKNYAPNVGEKYIPCYKDYYVKEDVEPNAIALLREPRSMQPGIYEYIEENYTKFKYVFTHDSILLSRLPNAKLIIWAGVWGWGDSKKDFTHPISMVAPEKAQVPLKVLRKDLAFELQDTIDCYGTYNGGEWARCEQYLKNYPFSIVIENYIDDYWITEKICNCFAYKTIPIYLGARKIDELFNEYGIIHVDSADDIRVVVKGLLDYGENEYNSRLEYVEDNFERVKEYEQFEDWFMKQYGDLLRGLL